MMTTPQQPPHLVDNSNLTHLFNEGHLPTLTMMHLLFFTPFTRLNLY